MIGIFIWTMIFLFAGVFIGYAIGSYLEMQKQEEPRAKELKSLEVEKMSKLLESVNKRDFDRRISEVVGMLEEKQLYGTISLIKDLKYYLDLATKEKVHTCNCQHNSNSRDSEPCHRCDSKQTNADRIRNMSDEELAEFNLCPHMVNWKKGNYDTCFHPNDKDACKKCMLDWLQSEAE